jgi:hypothetical protein
VGAIVLWGNHFAARFALLFAITCTPAVPAIKNMAVVASGSGLADVSLADLVKFAGTAKAGRTEEFCNRSEESRCSRDARRVGSFSAQAPRKHEWPSPS